MRFCLELEGGAGLDVHAVVFFEHRFRNQVGIKGALFLRQRRVEHDEQAPAFLYRSLGDEAAHEPPAPITPAKHLVAGHARELFQAQLIRQGEVRRIFAVEAFLVADAGIDRAIFEELAVFDFGTVFVAVDIEIEPRADRDGIDGRQRYGADLALYVWR